MGRLGCCKAGIPGLGSLVLVEKTEYSASGVRSTSLPGTLTERLGLYFCIQIRGIFTHLEEKQEPGGKILGGEVLGPVSGVSLCSCTGSPAQSLLPGSQGDPVSRACAEIFTLHPHYNMPYHGCIYPH